MNLTDLPFELLAEIGAWCTFPDRKSLRQTCSSVCSALDYLMFSDFTLKLDLDTMFKDEDSDTLIYNLASRMTCIGTYAHRLRVIMRSHHRAQALARIQRPVVSLRDRRQERWARFRETLVSALSSLTNVTVASITFDVRMKAIQSISGGQNLIDDLFRGLHAIQGLENVSIAFLDESIPSLGAFAQLHNLKEFHLTTCPLQSHTVERALRKILANSPNLTRLHLDGAYPYMPRNRSMYMSRSPAHTLDKIFQHIPPGHGPMPQLQHVEMRDWMIRKSPAMYASFGLLDTLILDQCEVHPGFWDGLGERGIFVRQLMLTVSEDGLAALRYLESNQRLETLDMAMSFISDSGPAVLEDLAQYFWLRVIPRCAPNLLELHVHCRAYYKQWSFCNLSRDSVRKCVNLRALSICVAIEPEHVPNHDVTSLLDSAKSLRHLQNLIVLEAQETFYLRTSMDRSIRDAVQKYTVEKDADGFDVLRRLQLLLAGSTTLYMLARQEDDEGVWKFQTDELEWS